MTDTWYDVLGVDPTASEAEIKGAWRSLVTVLGPTDHRFATINEAAGVLLDPDKRAAYDAGLRAAAVEAEPAAERLAASEPAEAVAEPLAVGESNHGRTPEVEDAGSADPVATAAEDAPTAPERPAARPLTLVERLSAPQVAVVTAVVAIALLAATAVLYLLQGDGQKVSVRTVSINLTDANLKPIKQQATTQESADVTAAIQAAVSAVPKALSYDYRSLAKNEADAKSVMTSDYAAKSFVPYFDGLVKANAPRLKQIVACGPVLDVGVVRTAPGVVEVLVLVDRFASNTSASGVSQDFADITMVDQNGTWLISNFGTAPIAKS